MGHVEQPGDVARVWYIRREDGQGRRSYWYFPTVLEARVMRDRLLDDRAIAQTGIELKGDGAWLEEN